MAAEVGPIELDDSDAAISETQREKHRSLHAQWRESKINYIRSHLPEEDRLLQLAEEADELSKACVKLVRYLRGYNPVDAKYSEDRLRVELVEEFTDVMPAADALEEVYRSEGDLDYKLDRWVDRVNSREQMLKEAKNA